MAFHHSHYTKIVDGSLEDADLASISARSTTCDPASNEKSRGLFECLPLELLSSFIEHLDIEQTTYWRCRRTFPTLKALRLSVRRFAYNRRLMEVLFRGIQLIATPAHLELLEKADVSRIAPYVQRLTFFPPFHSWALSYESFKEIVVSQAIQRRCLDHHIRKRSGLLTEEDDEDAKFATESWKKSPFSNEELGAGYGRYVDDAIVGKNLLESNLLLNQWTKTLEGLPNCRRYRVDSHKYNGYADDIPENPGCSIYKHKHDYHHREGTCRKSVAVLGEAVFGVAIHCLSRAQIRPKALDLRFASTGDFAWATLPGWAALDLSELKKLRFQPLAYCMDEWDPLQSGVEEALDIRARAALDGLLRRSESTIADLYIKGVRPLTWPDRPLVALPQLRRIELDYISLNNHEMAEMLSLMPHIEHFQLKFSGGVGSWKSLLDAIRNHRNRMDVSFEEVYCNDCYSDVSLSYNTDDVYDKDKHEDSWWQMAQSFQDYLAGKGRWNKCLKLLFQNDDRDPNEFGPHEFSSEDEG